MSIVIKMTPDYLMSKPEKSEIYSTCAIKIIINTYIPRLIYTSPRRATVEQPMVVINTVHGPAKHQCQFYSCRLGWRGRKWPLCERITKMRSFQVSSVSDVTICGSKTKRNCSRCNIYCKSFKTQNRTKYLLTKFFLLEESDLKFL